MSMSIAQLLRAVRKLPADAPQVRPGIWYKTQKEHWIGWLSEYHGPGAYGRKVDKKRNARYAYNHIVCHQMLLWIIDAAGIESKKVKAARRATAQGSTLQEKSAAIRRVVPWDELAGALWDEK